MAEKFNLIQESVKAALADATNESEQKQTEANDVTSSIIVPSPKKKSLRCYKQVNLASFRKNVKQIQSMAEKTGCDMIAVLKADAYGHDAKKLAQECLKMGIKAFATATVIEAIELRTSSQEMMDKNIKIIVLGVSVEDEYALFGEHSLDLMASGIDMIKSLMEWSKNKRDKNDKNIINVHCMMDTGMSRIGFEVDDCLDSIHSMHKKGKEIGLKFVGLCTHFADAPNEEYTLLQFNRFTTVLKKLDADNINVEMFHCENSNSLMVDVIEDETVKSYMDADTKGFVRIGGAMYGKKETKTQSLMSLYAQIRHIQEIKKGESVGYGKLFVAEEDCVIATLSIGYADGYPRGMSTQKQCVRIGDYLYDVAGKVCMDMMMVNLGNKDKNEQIKEIKVGDYAVLFGPKEEHKKNIDLDTMSELLGSFYSPWEITCGLTKRCPAIFIDDMNKDKSVSE